jgi:CubicO group peptidase (beta-lactamase class C family)
MEEYSVPGLALGMIIGGADQTSVLGVTSIENPLEVTEDTLFQIGSTTKTFTATVLAILADEGRLSLDDRVKVHVPELELADPDAAETITVRQLLNHTTGFAGDLFTNTGNGDDNTALYVELMRDLPHLIPPGTIAVYSNASFVLAGRVIETLTGETYEQSVKRIVLDPIGLDNALFDPAAVMLRRFAVGHTVHPDGKVVIASPWQLPRSVIAAGGLSSSIADQLRYARFQMGDESSADATPVLSKEARTEMQTRPPSSSMTAGSGCPG